jgi:ribosome-associated toxin RatA of RatAB toxin-antitoxin module
MRTIYFAVIVSVVFSFQTAFADEARFDIYDVTGKIWDWKNPDPYPAKIDRLDVKTLSSLLDSGNLQWYEPRPDKGEWDAVVMMKVHSSPEIIWDVITDYENMCDIMDSTYIFCETEWKKDNKARNNYMLETNSFNLKTFIEMVDIAEEYPPYRLRVNTIEGGLKGRELDFIIIPTEKTNETVVYLRYYAHMKSMGMTMRASLAILPSSEWPVTAASANYHLRVQRNEAEKRAGYKRQERPAKLDYHSLNIDTLAWLGKYNAGLIRETSNGDDISGLTYGFIDASPEVVWDLISDIESYEKYLKNQVTTINKQDGNEILAYVKVSSQKVLLFTFGYEMNALYTLDPPYHLSYKAIKGPYEGSIGDYYILPINDGKKCIFFCEVGINFEADNSLTSKIIASGDYPLSTVMNILGARTYINSIKTAVEK